jgi:two-component system sensor histidine kinase FlrB
MAEQKPPPKSPIDPRELEQAFSLFNLASEQLAGAYADLQQRVASLTGELAVANGELKRQFLEKEALSERLAGLLDALPAGVVVLDGAGRVAQANPAADELLGRPLLGESWAALQDSRLRRTSAPDEWESGDAALPRRMSISSRPLAAFGGELLLIHDITQAHAMQLELARHQRLSAMGEVAARLAHQLRTPLATALLYASHLNRPALADADRLRFSDKVLERLRHLEHLIQDMLLYVRGEVAGKSLISASEVATDLAQLIEPQMAARGIEFSVEDRSEGACIEGSRDALGGALMSLLENALQICREGDRVTLGVERDGGTLHFWVRDSGPGVDPAHMDRLFDPFFTTRPDGTGLGLAIVRSVAEAHGGEAAVSVLEGGGSQFMISLPVARMA